MIFYDYINIIFFCIFSIVSALALILMDIISFIINNIQFLLDNCSIINVRVDFTSEYNWQNYNHTDYIYNELLEKLNNKPLTVKEFLKHQLFLMKSNEYAALLNLFETKDGYNILIEKYLKNPDFLNKFNYYLILHKKIFIWQHTGIHIDYYNYDSTSFILLLSAIIFIFGFSILYNYFFYLI